MAGIDDILTRLANSQTLATTTLVDGMSIINAYTIKQSIPVYTGEIGGQSVVDWFETAEKIANRAQWTDVQKLRFFQDQLEKPASDFNDAMPAQDKVDYNTWKAAFSEGFKDGAFTQSLKDQLETLQQKPKKRVRDFKLRLEDLFQQVYGDPPPVVNAPPPAAPPPADQQVLVDHIKNLREERKRTIFVVNNDS